MYYLKLYVDLHPENKLKDISELEKINYRDVSIIENVIEGQVIGEAISIDTLEDSAEKEVVTKIKDLKELAGFIGNGLYIKKNEPSRLYAERSGHFIVKDGKFFIEDTIHLDEVSYKTGNITFVGDLFIHGDIKPGFTVNAKNLFVEGSVDNAQLIAGEKVIVKGGIIGLQNNDFCKVKAGSLAVLNFIENSYVECEGNVYIKKSSMHTDIYASGRIVIYGKPGVVIGGELIAKKNMVLRTVGSKWGTETILKIGIDPFKYLRLKNSENRLKRFLKLLEDVDKSIDYLNSVLEENKGDKSREELLEELENIKIKKEKFLKSIKRLENVIENLKTRIEKEKEEFNLDNTKIFIFEKINPGVELRVKLEHYKVYDDMGPNIVTCDEDDNVKFIPIDT